MNLQMKMMHLQRPQMQRPLTQLQILLLRPQTQLRLPRAAKRQSLVKHAMMKSCGHEPMASSLTLSGTLGSQLPLALLSFRKWSMPTPPASVLLLAELREQPCNAKLCMNMEDCPASIAGVFYSFLMSAFESHFIRTTSQNSWHVQS
mmetsp:Transcript_96318/g.171137  ORF Transcript_96318/g.171137 Transcript_96318/m.171137 type:complete len:147 (-) Transcript_96318:80-520(-)